jgi:hypothetical protein
MSSTAGDRTRRIKRESGAGNEVGSLPNALAKLQASHIKAQRAALRNQLIACQLQRSLGSMVATASLRNP